MPSAVVVIGFGLARRPVFEMAFAVGKLGHRMQNHLAIRNVSLFNGFSVSNPKYVYVNVKAGQAASPLAWGEAGKIREAVES
ncbi:hypothetical protein [Gallaecimonas xiamenensis]|uniref:hypothetical protein n=1 Tax=Gallaecimonas xiamenensis TaxID=1207039 RepID=UPI0004B3F6EE|nr:hypothetical protein [Gallaecimonas xiamenensis]